MSAGSVPVIPNKKAKKPSFSPEGYWGQLFHTLQRVAFSHQKYVWAKARCAQLLVVFRQPHECKHPQGSVSRPEPHVKSGVRRRQRREEFCMRCATRSSKARVLTLTDFAYREFFAANH